MKWEALLTWDCVHEMKDKHIAGNEHTMLLPNVYSSLLPILKFIWLCLWK